MILEHIVMILVQFIAKFGVIIILVFGVVLLIGLFSNGIRLKKEMENIKDKINGKGKDKRKRRIDQKSKEVLVHKEENSATLPDEVREAEKSFNNVCSKYNSWAQLISVCPLLGILGTVAGLMQEVGAGDITDMMASLDVAMGTTLWGLIFAIGLKILDALFPANVIYKVEVMLDDYDKQLSLAKVFDYKEENGD